jgi:hypothetical protein
MCTVESQAGEAEEMRSGRDGARVVYSCRRRVLRAMRLLRCCWIIWVPFLARQASTHRP